VRIAVCIKQIPNPEIASSVFRVDEEKMKVIPLAGMSPVTSPYDEQAIEAALRLRDAGTNCDIGLITLGGKDSMAALKRGLSLGADHGTLVECTDAPPDDGLATARLLAATIKSMEPVDLVLCGRQAADWDAGIVGPAIAEMLQWPVVTLAVDIRIDGEALLVTRVSGDVVETVSVNRPCVITVTNELGTVRKASLRETMRAAKKPMQAIPVDGFMAADSGSNATAAYRASRKRLYIPDTTIDCEKIAGTTSKEIAESLIKRLIELRAI